MSQALLAVGVAVAACVQATAGMGFALILSPILLVVLVPTTAIVLVTALGLTLNLLVLFRRGDRRTHVAWPEVRPMLLAAVPGSVCGLLVLRSLPKPALEIGVGTTVVLLTLLRLLPLRVRAPAGSAPAGRLAVGALAGALSTALGVSGPPLALWLSGRRLGFMTIRDSLAACFLGMGAITALTLIPTLGDVHLRAVVVICCMAAVFAGHALGSRLHPRIGPERLQGLLSLIVVASGVSAIVFGLTAL